MTATQAHIGFFGKLPSRGDFVRAALSRAAVEIWDGWVRTSLPAALVGGCAERWDELPCWRFALPAGLCGPHRLGGLWMPSRDRVGRPFPLLAAAENTWLDDGLLDVVADLCSQAIRTAREPAELADGLVALAVPNHPAIIGEAAWWRTPQGDHPAMRLAASSMPDPVMVKHMLGVT